MSQKPIPTGPEQAASRKPSRRTLIIGVIVLIFACGLCGLITTFFSDPSPAGETAEQPEATAEVVAAVEEAPTESPTNTPAPTDTPAPPTPTLEPGEALRAAIALALGNGNRDVDRLASVVDDNGRIEVDWAINDNLSEDLTRAGAQLDATEIVRAIAESGYDYEFILLRGTFPLVDQLGNVEETKVVELFFGRELVEQINFDNFLHRNIYDIADSSQIHPAFVRD